jgi:hypothetical protein
VATPSSTSSSSARLPHAVGVAALLLAGLELAVRVVHPDGTLPYALGEREYEVLQPELDAFGAREVSAVGSSHTREAVMAPFLAEALKRPDGQSPSVGNYALGGASAHEVHIVVRRLLEARPRPKLILYPMTPRQLSTKNDGASPNVRLQIRLSDLWRSRSVLGAKVDPFLPDALRNELSERSHLFRLRTEVQAAISEPPDEGVLRALGRMLDARRAPEPSPMRGELPQWKRGSKADSSLRVSQKRVRRYLEGRFDDPSWPRTFQARFLERTVDLCREQGVPLVFAEIPLAPILLQELPDGMYAKYLDYIAELAAKRGVPFIRLEELELAFGQRHFMEQSHLNLRGARKFSYALGARLAALDLPRSMLAQQ